VNLAYLTAAVAVLVIGVILARLLSKCADLALTGNTPIEPTVAKFLSNINGYGLWAVVGFVGTEAYTRFLLRGDAIE
jgi:small conductance mechanosensitive channel